MKCIGTHFECCILQTLRLLQKGLQLQVSRFKLFLHLLPTSKVLLVLLGYVLESLFEALECRFLNLSNLGDNLRHLLKFTVSERGND